MANAKKCDRCGEYYEKQRYDEGFEVQRVNYRSAEWLDLCPCCKVELENFLNDGGVRHNDGY